MESSLRTSVILRMVFVAVLTLLLLIPQMMIESYVTERQQRRDSVIEEISGKWGKDQIVAGPVLVVPFIKKYRNDEGKVSEFLDKAYLLPKRLEADVTLAPEIRHRSIFETVLYSARISLKGEFLPSDIEKLQNPTESYRWNEAKLILGISDLKGIRDSLDVQWNGAHIDLNPGAASQDIVPISLASEIPLLIDAREQRFDISMSLNGSNAFSLVPVGEQTGAKISGPWGNPSFVGEFLPDTRNVDPGSFRGNWKILHVNRNYPQVFTAGQYKIEASAFGVKLLLPIDEYQKTMRTTKYAVLFIALTFMAFFVSEILSVRAIHPVQYSLVAMVLLVFYILLLSLSEYLAFTVSYLTAGIAVIALITLYASKMLGGFRPALSVGGVLIALYGFLFVIVQAQDYALLFGSFGLFTSLALVMYLTRNVDWFALGKKSNEP